jgi:DNA primase
LKVDEGTIDKIRASVDIVDVIGEYVQLKKQGRNYFALCPFHSEKTPSFSVSPDKQIFHCFGCGVGGNVFTFIMEIEGISFPEAVRLLGEKAGIDVPLEGNQNSQTNDRLAILYHGMELLTKFYHKLLLDERYGKKALDYLRKRGFTGETIRRFQIGYAVPSWEAATRFLERRNLPLPLFEQVGLLSKRQFDGKIFDRFRDRIMFPIRDAKGRTVAFAGRVLGDQKPKYLNTPESNIFHKGRILFGYDSARPAIKRKNEVVLFEGYADVIRAYQAGIDNGVASMGTSLTEDQARLLTRNAEKIIICYDSDEAGTNAAFRAAEMLMGFGRTIKIARMPAGLDPDDYITRYGGERFRNDVIGASQTVMAFKMQYLKKGKNMNDEGDRLRYIEEVLREISTLNQAVERDHYLRQLADEFSLSLDALKQQQYQIYRRRKRKEEDSRHESRPIPYRNGQRHLLPAHLAAERQLLAHMMRDADIAAEVMNAIGASFHDDLHQALAAHLYAYYEEGRSPDVAAFIEKLEDPQLKQAATAIAMMEISEQASRQEIEDYIARILQYGTEADIQRKERERKEAEKRRDYETAAKILAEIIALKKKIGRH